MKIIKIISIISPTVNQPKLLYLVKYVKISVATQ